MNKKILTKVISFVLVICMLVPIIPDLGLDLFSVTADAAMPSQSTTAVLFKTGAKYYWNGSKNTMTAAPLYSAGSYYLPVAVVNTVTGASLSATKTFDGVGYIKVTHGGTVTGSWKTYISNMGFIQLTTGSNTISSASNDEQVAWIKSNVFSHTTYNSTAFKTSSMKTTDHPYLLANQDEFDYLNDVYTGVEDDPTLLTYLKRLVSDAEGIYNTCSTSGTTEGVLNATWSSKYNTMPNAPYGYDGGGRMGDSVTYASRVETLAYAYQVTRDAKFAKLALNMALGLSQWAHWGTGHFLNAADTSYHMALAFDWCYDVWGEINSTSRNTVRDALFTKGVMAGIYSSLYEKATYLSGSTISKTTNHYNPQVWYNNVLMGSGEIYINRDNNWNGVCSSGMILAALALMSETGSVTGLTVTAINSSGTQKSTNIFNTANSSPLTVSYKYNSSTMYYTIENALSANGSSVSAISNYNTASAFLINNNLYYLEQNGLAQYVPDGSYIESASYWSYGTNSIFRTIAALNSACGTDFGLSAAWGFDKTAYFANYAQDSNGVSWRYHDDTSESIDTSMNGIYGAIIGDENLVGYRKYLLEKGAAAPTIYDTLYYNKDVTGFEKTALDYYMPGIEGYAMRSSWENDSAYVAFMGGPNYVNHGQVDSGAFVYHNNGVAWFQDIGTDNYNAYEFGYGTSTTTNYSKSISSWSASTHGYMYYPQVAEGNNTVAVSGYAFGQNWGSDTTCTAAIKEHASNAYGGYAVLNQTNIYGGTSYRAILMTNNRKTVVIQDEITLKSSQDAYWVGHVYDSIKITISDDGKTAYLTDGKSTIRCTLISASGYTFTVEDATVHHINGTAANNYSSDKGYTAQNDYSAWQKLVVKASSTTSFKLAIAIEEVAVGDNFDCGYEWVDIANWSESMLTPDENNYDDKVLLNKDFDIEGIGTFSSKGGNLRIVNTLVNGDSAMGAYYVEGNTNASNITLAAATGKVASASIGNGMLVTEFDLMTASELPDVTFSLYGTDIYPIVSVSADQLASYIDTDWTHVTMVLDEENDMFYVYAGDTCIVKESFVSSSYENLKLVIASEAGTLDAGSLLIDNVIMRTYTETYTDLDSILNGSTVGASSAITDWSDSSYTAPEVFTGNVAKLYTKEVDAPLPDDDTPIVDFWSIEVVNIETEPGAELLSEEGTYVATFAELETAINSGLYTNVDLYTTNVKEPIEISKRIVVDTNGHEFVATSDNLICQVSGDIHTYKAGSVKVAFVVNGSTNYVTYYSTQIASFQASASAIGLLKGVDNGDGTFSYVMTKQDTWSLTPYGDPIMGNDLIVTSENSTFYLTGDPYSGYFVTVNGSTVTGYTTVDEFFTIMGNTSAYDKIVMTNDMYIESTNSHAVRGTKNLYLNGYTITYEASGSSNHFMTIGNASVTLNVYGPGVINNDSLASNIIMRTEYSTNNTTFNNLTINSKYTICDHREGTLEFNNCVINMEMNRSPFSVTNRSADYTPGSNADNGTVDEVQMAILVLNGGEVNCHVNTGNAAPVNLKDNSRVVLKGGVVINSPGTNAAIYVSHSTPTNIDGDTSGIDKMYIHLGEYYIDNCNKLYHYENNTGGAESDVDVEGHIYRVEGAGFTSSTTDYPLVSGYVLAKTGSAGYAYKVVKTEDAATVTWDGASSEYWVEGSTPTHTITNTAGAGKKTTYDLSALNGKGVVAGGNYNFKSVNLTNPGLMVGVALYSHIHVNIYVPTSYTYDYVMINGVAVDLASADTTTAPGYYYIVREITAKEAANLIIVSVKVNGDSAPITAVTSVINYASKVLASGEESAATKKLMASIVDYIGAIVAYSGDRYTKASCDALLESYQTYVSQSSMINAENPDTSAVKDAIKSVYMNVGSAPNFAFRFQSSFSGTVEFSYLDVKGAKQTVSVDVEDGKAEGSNTYLLGIKAYDMAGDITITVNGASCTYNIVNYYTQAVQSTDALYDLICALKVYCESAKAYKAA